MSRLQRDPSRLDPASRTNIHIRQLRHSNVRRQTRLMQRRANHGQAVMYRDVQTRHIRHQDQVLERHEHEASEHLGASSLGQPVQLQLRHHRKFHARALRGPIARGMARSQGHYHSSHGHRKKIRSIYIYLRAIDSLIVCVF